MKIETSDRARLKTYFVKNAVPSERNFVELIDGLLSQKDDGIAKPAGQPLSLRAEGDARKTVLNFYKTFADDATPAWAVGLNAGWSIADGQGNTRLLIDEATGNIGLGTAEPLAVLHLRRDAAGALGPVLRLSNGVGKAGAGAAIDFNGYEPAKEQPPTARIQSIDDGAASSHLAFATKQPGAVGNKLIEALRIKSNGNVGIGTDNPENKLQLAGNLHMVGNSIYFRADDPKDQYDFVRWNKDDDRLHVGGFKGVVLGHTQNGANKVAAVVTIDKTGAAIVQEDWRTPALENGWKNYGGDFNPAAYFKDSMGIVHLRGLIAAGTVATDWKTRAFNLPAGFRPYYRQLHMPGSSDTVGRVDILANGDLVVCPPSNKTWVALDGITFRAER